ncbi:transcription elongation factor subunit Spt4 [Thermofilum pendens]|uniref:Transcription elongation factor Spt4 n=1 Tax=Thermofilum pendens (strain DSM 2475 / Hrk 5) TaxID=368408 RepID=A1RX93_THEPD|nr:transcription elongation factor subunit Spt4 [Thermofilum pendens]ABL77823.1 DNA-directed RNA polymerase, subunit E'' [Thermofilum pendens Hrk 5]
MPAKRRLPLKACVKCKALVEDSVDVCPVCGSREFTDDWDGFVAVIDPEKSEAAKLLSLKQKGAYSVKVR